MPWRRWPRHAGGRRRSRGDHGAGVCRQPARDRTSRLRRQGPAPRPVGSGRRPHVRRCGDGADGIQSRRVDCVSSRSYIRNTFGNAAPFVTPADVARVRSTTTGRTSNWDFEALVASVPRPIASDASWKATASHNSDKAAQAFNFATWTTTVPQAPGMWFQVELAQPTPLTEVQFESSRIGGGRGAGAPPPSAGYPREVRARCVGRRDELEDRCQGGGRWREHRDSVRAGAGEVRQDYADGHDRRRTAMVDAATAPICTRKVAENDCSKLELPRRLESFVSETAPHAGNTHLRLTVAERGARPFHPSVHNTHATRY